MTRIADKVALRGIGALDDRELLTLLTDDEPTADALLSACGGSLVRIADEEVARLRMVGGLGLRRAQRVLAAAEFGRSVAVSRSGEAEVISTSDDVVRLFRCIIRRWDSDRVEPGIRCLFLCNILCRRHRRYCMVAE